MSFVDDGYEIHDFFYMDDVVEAQLQLTSMFGRLTSYTGDDERLHALAASRIASLPRFLIEANLPYFRSLLGADIHIQQKPFLRISRPGQPGDNIGLHRDTWYGDTPHEISVWIPLTDTDEGNALRVAPGSHLWSEAAHPVERFSGIVAKGSTKHDLGFIYGDPKRLANPALTIPLPARVGQMIVFSLALLHGQEVNTSTRTRFSMDVRLTNSLAPVKFSRSRNEHYYEELCVSPVTQAARLYYAAQKSSTSIN